MGVLTTRGRSALVLLTLLTACAVAPPPTALPPASGDLDCRAERGTPDGLILRLDVDASAAPEDVIYLAREGEVVGQAAVGDLPELPFTLRVGDTTSVEPGAVVTYACWLEHAGEAGVRRVFEAAVPERPARPRAPEAAVAGDRVRLDWPDAADLWVQVLRRDVLAGSAAVPISPRLLAAGWEDTEIVPGGVYAYALQVARIVDDVPWESAVGPERYVEVPE